MTHVSDVCDIKIGCRVQDKKTGDRGVVKYNGCVDGSTGIWLGIDWDDTKRGKHNGTHQGHQYFEARTSISGSFVRPSKITVGVSVEEATREKYQTPPPDPTQVEHMLQHAINARFVQFVGMEKISQKQRALETLHLVDLKDCSVSHSGNTDLSLLLPRLTHLNLTGCLIHDWSHVAEIAAQLPKLKILNLSDNRLQKVDSTDQSLSQSLSHVTHLILNNMLEYSWNDLMDCAVLFPHLNTLQIAFNKLSHLGPVPHGALQSLQCLDVGANPISEWSEILHLSNLPMLKELNVNNCQLPLVEFPDTDGSHSTSHFQHLQSLCIANNPLDNWRSVCQIAKLKQIKELVLGFEVKPNDYFPEFTYAIIRTLKKLNRTEVTKKEKRDYELFYLKTFSADYYRAGGSEENPENCVLSAEFTEMHPTYTRLVEELGAPYDENKDSNKSSSLLKDQKINVRIVSAVDDKELERSVLPSLKVTRLKMMIKRAFKLPGSAKLALLYTQAQDGEKFNIPLDSDHKELEFYSIADGDTISVSW